jgi:thiol-disulfide isomerase/thioredoxin
MYGKTLSTVTALLLIINTLQATARFNLKVTDPSVFVAECTTHDSTNEEFGYKIQINPTTGMADFALDIAFSQFITFSYGAETIELFVEPTDDLKMSFVGNQLLKTIEFSGDGAANNRCWIAFKRRFRNDPMSNYSTDLLSPKLDSTTVSRATNWTHSDYLTFANADREAELDFIHTHKALILKRLYSTLWKNVMYTYDTKLYAFFLFKKMPKEEARRIADRFFPERGFNYADYERNETVVFRNALKTFVHFQARLQLDEDENKDALYETIEKKMINYDRFWLEKELLVEVLNKERSFSFGRQRIDQYRKDCTFPELVKELDSKFDNYLDVTERAEAPDFQLVTADGQVKKLSDFKGRVVFINFWASWCKPCLANFSKYANTRQQLYSEGVVLLNLSIDEQPPQYRVALNRLNPIGVNGQPIDMKEAKKQYGLYEIPAYYLVDKQGRLVHLADKQGGDMSEFRKLLAE